MSNEHKVANEKSWAVEYMQNDESWFCLAVFSTYAEAEALRACYRQNVRDRVRIIGAREEA